MTTTKAEELAECWINPDPKHPDDWFSRFERAGWVRFVPASVDQQAERDALQSKVQEMALQALADDTQHREVEAERDALLAAIPDGCTPADAATLRAANHQLAAERDALLAALTRVLDTHEREAKAYLTAQVASENFSRRSAKADEHAHLQAAVEASKAEKEARELLAAIKGAA